MTRLAPHSTDAWARPHELAWNIGTTGSTRSASHSAALSAVSTPMACSSDERWL